MRLKLAIAGLLVLGLAVSQTSTEKAYVWTLEGNQMKLREITGVVWNAATKTWSVPASQPTEAYTRGQGINMVRVAGQPTVIEVDTAAFYMWVAPPSVPGPCRSSVPISDQKILASDSAYLYVCVPYKDATGDPATRWGRAPLEFTW